MVWKVSGKNRSQEKQYDYSGIYILPSYVQNEFGRFRILAYPILQGFVMKSYIYSNINELVFRNAVNYIKNTKFEQFGMFGLNNVRVAKQIVRDIIAEDDGYFRKETTRNNNPIDVNTHILEEQIVVQGEDVCLLGNWSSVKQGIVFNKSNTSLVLLTKGLPAESIKFAKKVAFANLGLGLIYFLVINIIVANFWVIINIGPKYGKVIYYERENGKIIQQQVMEPSNLRENE